MSALPLIVRLSIWWTCWNLARQCRKVTGARLERMRGEFVTMGKRLVRNQALYEPHDYQCRDAVIGSMVLTCEAEQKRRAAKASRRWWGSFA
jgi:hypothetical protein